MKKVLIIPDAHVLPNQSLKRFTYVGKVIVDVMPDYIVSLGDFNSMESMSHWDSSKPLIMEGRRYHEDMLWGEKAIDTMSAPLRALQEYQQMQKKKVYRPKVVWIDGNHEEWAVRYAEQNAQMEGFLNPFKQQKVEEYFDEVEHIPFRSYKLIEGVAFTHSPIAANRQCVSGKYAIARALELFDTSVIFGHTHRYEVMHSFSHGSGKRRCALSCGCYWEDTPPYVQGAQSLAVKALTLVTLLGDGAFDFSKLSYEFLQEVYG